MKKSIAVLVLCSVLPFAASAADGFKDVSYFYKADGKDKTQKIEGRLIVDSVSLKFESKKAPLDIADSEITKIIYERSSQPRYAEAFLISPLFLFSKSKQHFLTFHYASKYALFRLDKGNFREILAAIEASTGKKIERSEEK